MEENKEDILSLIDDFEKVRWDYIDSLRIIPTDIPNWYDYKILDQETTTKDRAKEILDELNDNEELSRELQLLLRDQKIDRIKNLNTK